MATRPTYTGTPRPMCWPVPDHPGYVYTVGNGTTVWAPDGTIAGSFTAGLTSGWRVWWEGDRNQEPEIIYVVDFYYILGKIADRHHYRVAAEDARKDAR